MKNGPRNKLGFNLNYLTHMPALGLDLTYRYNRFWNFYFTISKNWNPMMAAMGGSAFEAKLV
jgi:hypothetical protein